MAHLVLIGLGGFIGSVMRYLASGWVQEATKSSQFPYGTLAVNVIGCLLIGLLSQLADARGALTPDSRAFLIVGLLGGFTTFSTFGNESMSLLRAGQSLSAFVNVGGHIFLGLGAVWLGRVVAYAIWR